MSKTVKIIFSIILICCLFTIISPLPVIGISNIVTGADDFIQDGTVTPPIDVYDFEEMSTTLYNILLVIAIIVAVIVGMVIGIKLMTGSISEKAKTKEMIIPYIAGCIVIFGAFAIWRIVVSVLSEV